MTDSLQIYQVYVLCLETSTFVTIVVLIGAGKKQHLDKYVTAPANTNFQPLSLQSSQQYKGIVDKLV